MSVTTVLSDRRRYRAALAFSMSIHRELTFWGYALLMSSLLITCQDVITMWRKLLEDDLDVGAEFPCRACHERETAVQRLGHSGLSGADKLSQGRESRTGDAIAEAGGTFWKQED